MPKMRKTVPKRTTMADLAALAGVAKITVSRALAGSPAVRPEVRRRIEELATEHGYRINSSAQSLRRQRTDSIAAVIEMDPSTERPMFEPLVLMMIGAMLQEATLAGYRLVLTIRSQVERGAPLDVDGILLLGQGAHDASTQTLRKLGIPMVVWGAPSPGLDDDIAFLGSDNRAGGALIASHLVSLGRSRVLFVGDTAHPEVQTRMEGLEAGLKDSGARMMQVPSEFNRGAARSAMLRALEFGVPFDAVVAASDEMAVGVIGALRDRGLRVPEDVCVVGFDDAIADADLTTVRQDFARAGREGVRLLLKLIAADSVPALTLLPIELVVRGSTRSAPLQSG
jgi:DNA-binding LacI/PurR family transcriptional regulator